MIYTEYERVLVEYSKQIKKESKVIIVAVGIITDLKMRLIKYQLPYYYYMLIISND